MAKYLTVLEGKTRTTTTVSEKFTNWEDYEGAQIIVDVTSGGNLVVDVKGYDDVSGQGFTILTSQALPTGVSVLRVGPAYTAGANIAKDYLPAIWYVSTTLSGSTAFSIGASVI